MAWTGNQDLSGLVIKGEGTAPSGPDQVAIDKATADREHFAVGDQIQVITDTGTGTYTITALVGLGDSDGFAGASLAAWDVATAQQVFGTPDQYDGVDVQVHRASHAVPASGGKAEPGAPVPGNAHQRAELPPRSRRRRFRPERQSDRSVRPRDAGATVEGEGSGYPCDFRLPRP